MSRTNPPLMHKHQASVGEGWEPPKGSGLGLSTAAWIATVHDGEIRAENVDEGGCRLVVSFPLGAT